MTEQQIISHLAHRLATEFPTVAADDLRQLVQDNYQRFSHSRVRDYVPLFVERNVRAQLTTPSR